ncbi:alpha/beta hydrolase [Chloroflexi bacterium TSY]|nr:alpha/beta hydrolase [Chloroflexi bacterium TSY]
MSIPKTITLRDGRTLAYVECGDAKGAPVFHFHGHPGSRLESLIADKAARSAGVRLIGIDRPGMGFSDFKVGRRLLDWPDDVVELADALGLNQFSVQGASGGGPYAIACAYRLADRLLACGIIAGLGPIHRLGTDGMMLTNRVQFALARRMPWLVRGLLWAYLGRYGKYVDNEDSIELLASKMTQGLQNSTKDPDAPNLYIRETLEAFRQGSRGVAYDASLFTRPWGFELEDVTFENVYLWHGERDRHVPVEMARVLATKIPHCRARYFVDENHMAVVFNHLDEVLKAMVLLPC